MKRWITTLIVILLVLVGLFLLLYPTLSDYMNSRNYRQAIADFQDDVEKLDEETYEDLLAGARAFNSHLADKGGALIKLSKSERAEYESLLNFTGNGIMGDVTIEKIGVSLPIYHGTDEAVLQRGVGHQEGTSFPIAGESVHAVISGHSGMPSARLFTDIDQLELGDTFTIRILKETLTYEVDRIQTLLPEAIDDQIIEKGREYCTLMTCTPYGINTHRLLVRGHRIETPAAPGVPMEKGRPGLSIKLVLLGGAVLLGVLLVLAALLLRHDGLKRYRGHRLKERRYRSKERR